MEGRTGLTHCCSVALEMALYSRVALDVYETPWVALQGIVGQKLSCLPSTSLGTVLHLPYAAGAVKIQG